MLAEIVQRINVQLEDASSRVRLQSINDDPTVFLQYLQKEDKRERIAFFHICKRKKLLNDLKNKKCNDLTDLNNLLNASLGKLVIHQDKRTCGKCDAKMPDNLHSKLAIIEASEKLQLK